MLFTELFKLDDRNTMDNFQQVAAIEITTFPQTRSKIIFDAIWTRFKHTCSNQDDRNTVDNFQQVAALELQT